MYFFTHATCLGSRRPVSRGSIELAGVDRLVLKDATGGGSIVIRGVIVYISLARIVKEVLYRGQVHPLIAPTVVDVPIQILRATRGSLN